MSLEQIKPNKPNFGLVAALFAVTILLVFIAAWIIVTWRAHNRLKAPFAKHPVAQLAIPAPPTFREGAAALRLPG